MMLTPKELAVILDAEGSICIVLSNMNSQVTPVVCLEMTDKHYPQELHEQFGGYLELKKSKNPKHSDRWNWVVKGRATREVLTYVLPELQLKRKQAEALLLFVSTIKAPGGSNKGRVSDREQLLRWALYELVKKLNRKGPPIPKVEEVTT